MQFEGELGKFSQAEFGTARSGSLSKVKDIVGLRVLKCLTYADVQRDGGGNKLCCAVQTGVQLNKCCSMTCPISRVMLDFSVFFFCGSMECGSVFSVCT
jgi:hypothetical protein